MTQLSRAIAIPNVVRENPLQAGKFVGILLALAMGVAGFFRMIDVRSLLSNPLAGD